MPATSSNLPKAGGPRQRFCSVLLRMGFTYAPPVTRKAVVSCTALPPLPDSCIARIGGIFLLHFPWSRLHRTLSGILPCEARTFLTCCLSALTAAITCLTCLGYYITSYFKIQFLFCNSLIHDQIMPISRRCRQCITSFILRMSIMTFYPDKCNMMRFLCF